LLAAKQKEEVEREELQKEEIKREEIQKEEIKREEFQKEEVKREETQKDEPLLTEEEITVRIKSHHPTAGTVFVGGRRITQRPNGPFIIPHKPTLVEQRDEKRKEEMMGETAESTTKELVKEESHQELTMKQEKMYWMSQKAAGGESEQSKGHFPSTFCPPEPKHENVNKKKENRKRMGQFQPPLRSQLQ